MDRRGLITPAQALLLSTDLPDAPPGQRQERPGQVQLDQVADHERVQTGLERVLEVVSISAASQISPGT